MGNVGRVFCVALPIIMIIGAIGSLLAATLAGVAHQRLFLFHINMTEASISQLDLQNLANKAGLGNIDFGNIINNAGNDIKNGGQNAANAFGSQAGKVAGDVKNGADQLGKDISNTANNVGNTINHALNGRFADIEVRTDNITAKKFGLADAYDVSLWGYCRTVGKDRTCTSSQFDWASHVLNDTYLNDLGASVGIKNVALPKELIGAIHTYNTVNKFTEIAFIVALVALGIELVIGIFATMSRAVSCLVYVWASFATLLVFVACGMATALATAVIGAVEATAKFYGVRANFYSNFLAVIWIGAAFTLGANLFWIFTICCCKPEHRRNKYARDSYGDSEKLIPQRGYAPLNNDHEHNGFYNNQAPQRQSAPTYNANPRYPSGAGRTDLAYEPYSHRA